MMLHNKTLMNGSRMNSTIQKLHFEAKVISFFGSMFSMALCFITLSILAWYISRKKSMNFEQACAEDHNAKNTNNSNPEYDEFCYLKAPVRNKDEDSREYNSRMELKSIVYETPTIPRDQLTQSKNDADIYCNSMQHQNRGLHNCNDIYANMDANPDSNDTYLNTGIINISSNFVYLH